MSGQLVAVGKRLYSIEETELGCKRDKEELSHSMIGNTKSGKGSWENILF